MILSVKFSILHGRQHRMKTDKTTCTQIPHFLVKYYITIDWYDLFFFFPGKSSIDVICKRETSFEWMGRSAWYITLIINITLAFVKVSAFWQDVIMLLEYFSTGTECIFKWEKQLKPNKQNHLFWWKNKSKCIANLIFQILMNCHMFKSHGKCHWIPGYVVVYNQSQIASKTIHKLLAFNIYEKLTQVI